MASKGFLLLVAAAVALAAAGPALAAPTARATGMVPIYAGPGYVYPVIGRLQNNEVVSLDTCTYSGVWCQLKGHSPNGWVLSSYLVGSAAKLQAAPPKFMRPLGAIGPFGPPFPR